MKPRFNYAHMRKVFYSWHGGQWSHLYAAASSGLVDDVDALASELRQCAELIYADASNFKHWNYVNGKPTQSGLKASAHREWVYLRSVADSLDLILSSPFVHPFDNRTYRALPWGKK